MNFKSPNRIFQGTTGEEEYVYETDPDTEIETEPIIADDDDYEYVKEDEESDAPLEG